MAQSNVQFNTIRDTLSRINSLLGSIVVHQTKVDIIMRELVPLLEFSPQLYYTTLAMLYHEHFLLGIYDLPDSIIRLNKYLSRFLRVNSTSVPYRGYDNSKIIPHFDKVEIIYHNASSHGVIFHVLSYMLNDLERGKAIILPIELEFYATILNRLSDRSFSTLRNNHRVKFPIINTTIPFQGISKPDATLLHADLRLDLVRQQMILGFISRFGIDGLIKWLFNPDQDANIYKLCEIFYRYNYAGTTNAMPYDIVEATISIWLRGYPVNLSVFMKMMDSYKRSSFNYGLLNMFKQPFYLVTEHSTPLSAQSPLMRVTAEKFWSVNSIHLMIPREPQVKINIASDYGYLNNNNGEMIEMANRLMNNQPIEYPSIDTGRISKLNMGMGICTMLAFFIKQGNKVGYVTPYNPNDLFITLEEALYIMANNQKMGNKIIIMHPNMVDLYKLTNYNGEFSGLIRRLTGQIILKIPKQLFLLFLSMNMLEVIVLSCLIPISVGENIFNSFLIRQTVRSNINDIIYNNLILEYYIRYRDIITPDNFNIAYQLYRFYCLRMIGNAESPGYQDTEDYLKNVYQIATHISGDNETTRKRGKGKSVVLSGLIPYLLINWKLYSEVFYRTHMPVFDGQDINILKQMTDVEIIYSTGVSIPSKSTRTGYFNYLNNMMTWDNFFIPSSTALQLYRGADQRDTDADYTSFSDIPSNELIGYGRLFEWNYRIYSVGELISVMELAISSAGQDLPYDPAFMMSIVPTKMEFDMIKRMKLFLGDLLGESRNDNIRKLYAVVNRYIGLHLESIRNQGMKAIFDNLLPESKPILRRLLFKILDLGLRGLNWEGAANEDWSEVTMLTNKIWNKSGETNAETMAQNCLGYQTAVVEIIDQMNDTRITDLSKQPLDVIIMDNPATVTPYSDIEKVLASINTYYMAFNGISSDAASGRFWSRLLKPLLTGDYCIQLAARYVVGTAMFYLTTYLDWDPPFDYPKRAE